MGRRGAIAGLCLPLVTSVIAAQQPDQPTYADSATAALVAFARARHERQDSLVRDYRAHVSTRIDASVGRSRFARLFPLVAHETAARVLWRRPNDLKLEVLGVRQRSVFPDADTDVAYDRPWFVPRALGDSIHLMGIPETAALHPLAPGAESFYNYAISDSVVMSLPGRVIRAIAIRVTPRELGPSVVAGDMWVDAESADVVRLIITFLGEYLWDLPDADASSEDSAEVRSDNQWAQRLITVQADIEYSLWENRYWMPYRQLLALTVEVNFLVRGALPVRFLTSFRDYEINVDPVFTFVEPTDSLDEDDDAWVEDACERGPVHVDLSDTPRPPCPEDLGRDERRDEYGYTRGGRWAGGRWEIAIPPLDSLTRFQWRDSLDLEMKEIDIERIRETVANLAEMAEDLPHEWMGRRRFGLAWDEVADVLRFNRVQGLSAGLGYEVRPGPRFTTVRGSVRFGLSDRRVTGSLSWRRDSPAGLLDVTGFRSVLESEPWTSGQSLGNSLNAAFAAHDDADYYLGNGASISYNPYAGRFRDTEFTIAVERQRSMRTRTGSSLNDALGGTGVMAPNPAVLDGDYVRARIRPSWRLGRATFGAGVEALIGGDGRGGRAWATARIPFTIVERSGALSLKVGHTAGDSLPQLRFRAGGPATVRGYGYGTLRGRGVWSAQLDFALTPRWAMAPVVFVDAGNVFDVNQHFRLDDALVGIGAGVSFLRGWVRFNIAKGMNPSTDLRFDLLFGAPR